MSLVDRLSGLYTGAIYDVLRARGLADQALPASLNALEAAWATAGEIFTVSGHVEEGLDEHECLVRWTTFLGAAPPDSVVICQPNDSSVSHMGELSAETLHHRGVRGYIVDGGCRDVALIASLGFPVWCRYTTPADIVGRWSVGEMGEPITIGDVTIESGDYVAADRDGVVIIPRGVAEGVIEEAERVMQTENLVRKAILEGEDPRAAYLNHGKF